MTRQLLATAFAIGVAVSAGVLLIITSLTPRSPDPVKGPNRRWPFTEKPGRGLVAVIAGFLIAALTGWILAGVVAAALAIS